MAASALDLLRATLAETAGHAWWDKMTPHEQRAYMAKHPHSHMGRTGMAEMQQNLRPAQAKGLNSFAESLTGPDGKLTDEARTRVNASNFKPADLHRIARLLRKAHDTVGAEQAEKAGMKATVATMAAAGLMIAGGAGLVGLGVPAAVFTPRLIKDVWQRVNPRANGGLLDDNHLVTKFCDAIHQRFQAGIPAPEVQKHLVKTNPYA